MKQCLDKTKFNKEVWERNEYWYAKVSSDFEDEGSLTDGGYFYKREQSQKMRIFSTKEEAETWADRSISVQQLALSTGR